MGFAPTGASAESALHSLSPYNSDQASLAVFVANYSVLTLSLILSLILLERGVGLLLARLHGDGTERVLLLRLLWEPGDCQRLSFVWFFSSSFSLPSPLPLLFLPHALCLCRPLVKKSVLATQPAMALQVTSICLTWCSKATRRRARRPRPWGESPRMRRTWTRCLK